MKRFLWTFLVIASVCMSVNAENTAAPVVPDEDSMMHLGQSVGQAAIKLKKATAAVDDLLVLEVGGQVYYVRDLELLEDLVESGQNMCFSNGYQLGSTENLYKVLYDSCNQSRATLEGMAKQNFDIVNSGINKADRLLDKLKYKGNYKELLKQCLINVQVLRDVLSNVKFNTHFHTIGRNIDTCIKSVEVSKQALCRPGIPIVPHSNCLDYMSDLDSQYAGSVHQFQDNGFVDGSRSSSDKVLVFNGKVLVACQGGKAQFIINPSFSGRQECQGGEYKQIPNVGSLPNGVYLAMNTNNPESFTSENDLRSWGKYRVPLIAAVDTNNYGRTNFYLHGTSRDNHFSSGGCISMGINVDRLVEDPWFSSEEYIPVIVSVPTNSITQAERDECMYKDE